MEAFPASVFPARSAPDRLERVAPGATHVPNHGAIRDLPRTLCDRYLGALMPVGMAVVGGVIGDALGTARDVSGGGGDCGAVREEFHEHEKSESILSRQSSMSATGTHPQAQSSWQILEWRMQSASISSGA